MLLDYDWIMFVDILFYCFSLFITVVSGMEVMIMLVTVVSWSCGGGRKQEAALG